MSANEFLPAMDARPSAVSQFIYLVTDKVSTPSWMRASTPSWILSRSSGARSWGGISFSLAALTIVFWIFCSATALAQNDVGSIVGFVTDSSGAVVPNAKVIIRNEGTGESRTVSTDGSGHYAVPNLPPTSYTMTAEATGFQKFESTHNVLASNSTISIDAATYPRSGHPDGRSDGHRRTAYRPNPQRYKARSRDSRFKNRS